MSWLVSYDVTFRRVTNSSHEGSDPRYGLIAGYCVSIAVECENTSCRWTREDRTSSRGLVGQTLTRTQRAEIDVDYLDTLSLSLSTSVLINFPKPRFAVLPVALGVELQSIGGTVSVSGTGLNAIKLIVRIAQHAAS
jgi:hypothetical protein